MCFCDIAEQASPLHNPARQKIISRSVVVVKVLTPNPHRLKIVYFSQWRNLLVEDYVVDKIWLMTNNRTKSELPTVGHYAGITWPEAWVKWQSNAFCYGCIGVVLQYCSPYSLPQDGCSSSVMT